MEMPEDGVWWLNYSQYEDLRLYEVGDVLLHIHLDRSYAIGIYCIMYLKEKGCSELMIKSLR